MAFSFWCTANEFIASLTGRIDRRKANSARYGCDKVLMKGREQAPCETAQFQKMVSISNKDQRAPWRLLVCVCAEAFCNGKQGINNPNMMREMVSRTKLKGFTGPFTLCGW